MLWCFGSAVLAMLLLGLVALTVHPLRLLTHLKLVTLLRGCLALLCLGVALLLVGMGMLVLR
jgi:hypothetical protein